MIKFSSSSFCYLETAKLIIPIIPKRIIQKQHRELTLLSGSRLQQAAPFLESAGRKTKRSAMSSKLSPEEEKRAEKMFEELNALMTRRQQKIDEEQSKSWSSAIRTFWKTSKHQLINVAAAFGCVLMAIQVTDARIAARKNAALLKQTADYVDDLEHILYQLSSQDFANATAAKCVRSVQNSDGSPIGNPQRQRKPWISFSSDRNKKPAKDEDINSIKMAHVIRKEIKWLLGDKYVFNEVERTENEIKMLQSFLGTGDELNPAAKELLAAVGEKEELKKEDGATVIKKRRIMF